MSPVINSPSGFPSTQACIDKFYREEKKPHRQQIPDFRRFSSNSDFFPLTSNMLARTFSVVILGEFSVGKSALCKSFFHYGASDSNDCVYDDQLSCGDYFGNGNGQTLNHHVYERSVLAKGEPCNLRILDVNTEKHLVDSGEDNVASSLHNFMVNGEACIVAYAITDKGTYTTAKEILSFLLSDGEAIMHDKPIILVGNKCDLVRKRQVTTNEGLKLAKLHNVKFVETSATLNQNVEELFCGVISQIRLRDSAEKRRMTIADLQQTPKLPGKRPPLIKRVSSTLLSPFNNARNRRVADQQENGVKWEVTDGSKVKGKRRLLKTRRSRTAEIHSNNECQNLSII